jgi:hypothetical protein
MRLSEHTIATAVWTTADAPSHLVALEVITGRSSPASVSKTAFDNTRNGKEPP